jgi:hypothetical protein
VLDIPIIKSEDKPLERSMNEKLQSPLNKKWIYNQFEFKIESSNKCGKYQHIRISKKGRNTYDLRDKTYRSLFLLIIDPTNKVVSTEKLEETRAMMRDDSTNWNLSQDSILTIDSKYRWCSDMEIEGVGSQCWTETLHKVFKLRCDGLDLIQGDSLRTSSIE